MATEVVRYVDPDATGTPIDGTTWDKAYRSLSAWNTAEVTNLVTADKYHTVHCRSSGGTADALGMSISNWTTDATHYVTVIGDDFPSNGVLNETKYRLTRTNATSITIGINYSRFVNLQMIIVQSGVGAPHGFYVGGVDAGGSDIRIDSCIIKGICSGTGSGEGIYVSDVDATVNIFNTIIYGFISGSDIDFLGFETGTGGGVINFYNCTIFGNYYGMRRVGGTVTVKNCAVFNNTDDFGGTMTIDYCASDDGDGTNAQDFTAEATDWNAVFTDYAVGNVSLKNYTTPPCCVGVGTDNPGSGLYSDDIIGTARASIWDIGAFEYEPSSSLSGTVIVQSNVEGSLKVLYKLIATIVIKGVITGDITIKGLQLLAGTINSQSIIAANLKNLKALAGVIISQSIVIGTLGNTRYLSGNINITSTAGGAIKVVYKIASAIEIQSVVLIETINVSRKFAGTIISGSTIDGILFVFGTKLLVGTITCSSIITGNLIVPTGEELIKGVIAAKSIVIGNLVLICPEIPPFIQKDLIDPYSGGAWLWLCEIAVPGYDTQDIARNTENVICVGKEYNKWNFDVGGQLFSSDGSIPHVTLRVGQDPDKVIEEIVNASEGAYGGEVKLIRVNEKFLDYEIAALEVNYSVLVAESDDEWVYFTLGIPNPLTQRMPLRIGSSKICPWAIPGLFKGVECQYTGVDTSCKGTFDDCYTKGNAVHWGGEIGLDPNVTRV